MRANGGSWGGPYQRGVRPRVKNTCGEGRKWLGVILPHIFPDKESSVEKVINASEALWGSGRLEFHSFLAGLNEFKNIRKPLTPRPIGKKGHRVRRGG